MNTHLIRRVPSRAIDRRLGRFFDHAFNDFLAPLEGEEVSTSAWIPPVDIHETPEALTLYAEIAGVAKDDVQLSVENGRLTISGERKFEKDTEAENYHRVERSFGTFERAFSLPKNVDPAGVRATFQDGVLKVTLPKAEESKPRSIEIQ